MLLRWHFHELKIFGTKISICRKLSDISFSFIHTMGHLTYTTVPLSKVEQSDKKSGLIAQAFDPATATPTEDEAKAWHGFRSSKQKRIDMAVADFKEWFEGRIEVS